MAIFSFHVGIVSRSKGHSVVAAAAYRSGKKLEDTYAGETHDYRRKQGVLHEEIFLPAYAPDWMQDRAQLWNSVERSEKQGNSQLARQIEFALPKELTREQNILLAGKYAQEFVREGMVADLAVHVDEKDSNPHAHLLLTMRPLNEDGSWGAKCKKEYILDEHGERIKLAGGHWKSRRVDTTDWDRDYKVEHWRENLSTLINEDLKQHDHVVQVDHRSYERQGIERIPTIHLGHYAHQLEQSGQWSERGEINRQILEENKRLEALDKELAELTKSRVQTSADQGSGEQLQHSPDFKSIYGTASELPDPVSTLADRYKQPDPGSQVQTGQSGQPYHQPPSLRESFRRASEYGQNPVPPLDADKQTPAEQPEQKLHHPHARIEYKERYRLLKEHNDSTQSYQSRDKPHHEK